MPVIDDIQDWELKTARENGSHTSFKFTRPFIPCDKKHDFDITEDTIRIIYAFGEDDPDDEQHIKMHRSINRGSKSVVLLEPESPKWLKNEKHEVLDIKVDEVG